MMTVVGSVVVVVKSMLEAVRLANSILKTGSQKHIRRSVQAEPETACSEFL